MMQVRQFRVARSIRVLAVLAVFSSASAAVLERLGGIKPDSGVLFVSATTAQAQMGLENTENHPLLLKTEIVDVPEDEQAPELLVLPPITRVEGRGRQIVRFVFAPGTKPISVQHYKRVTFEGIPALAKTIPGSAQVKLNLRYDLPVIISPDGLARNDSPWELLEISRSGQFVTVRNPSPYVVRASSQVAYLPIDRKVDALGRTFILPGDVIKFKLPDDIDGDAVESIRLFPVSAYGGAADPFDVKIK